MLGRSTSRPRWPNNLECVRSVYDSQPYQCALLRSSILVIRTGASGSIVTSNASRGQLSPRPRALMKASLRLRVQHLRNANERRSGGSALSDAVSAGEKKRSASSSASGTSQISSTSTPTARLGRDNQDGTV